jgi:hypothetical protein
MPPLLLLSRFPTATVNEVHVYDELLFPNGIVDIATSVNLISMLAAFATIPVKVAYGVL